jgi:hypothetical protein
LSDQHLELRLSRELPTFALFWADETVYFNAYLRGRDTYHSPCFEFRHSRRPKTFTHELRRHFDMLWASLGPAPQAPAG